MGQETPRPPKRPILARPAGAALYAILTFLVAAAALSSVMSAHADRRRLATGGAEWIWYGSGTRSPSPLRFFAAREFVLPADPSRATAKVFVDREHGLFVNGTLVGRATQRPGDPLRLYRVESLLHAGANRIVIEASSPTGVGGILFSLDCDRYGRDALVSDGGWRVDPSDSGDRYRPLVWGRPPMFPWGYPRMPRPAEGPP